jgi:hypothetical protein
MSRIMDPVPMNCHQFNDYNDHYTFVCRSGAFLLVKSASPKCAKCDGAIDADAMIIAWSNRKESGGVRPYYLNACPHCKRDIVSPCFVNSAGAGVHKLSSSLALKINMEVLSVVIGDATYTRLDWAPLSAEGHLKWPYHSYAVDCF